MIANAAVSEEYFVACHDRRPHLFVVTYVAPMDGNLPDARFSFATSLVEAVSRACGVTVDDVVSLTGANSPAKGSGLG